MNNRLILSGAIFVLLLVVAPASADDLSRADNLLCSTSMAIVCFADGECESGPPWKWNVPDFVEIDLKSKMMRTTAASQENRQSPIEVVRRDEGLLLLQGMEQGKAFSVVISEEVGSLSAAVIREDKAVTIFGSCTPMQPPTGKEGRK